LIGIKLLTNNRLKLNFKWSREKIDLIKSIPGASFNPEDKYWSIPREQVHLLEHMFPESLAWLTPPYVIKGVEPDLPTHEDLTLVGDIEGKKLDPYPFQKVGISFLVEKKNALLADDMGLGKTLEALFAALELYNRGEIEKMLVVCPSSLKKQWGNEAHKFLEEEHIDKDLVTVIDGTKSQRKKLYKKAKDSFITVLNYSLLYYDFDLIKGLKADLITLDEAHYIKSRSSKRTKKIKKLKSKYKFALTGTPVQNKPDELYSFIEFIDKDFFGPYSTFKKEYIVEDYSQGYPILQGYINFEELNQKVAPLMLRRKLEDVKGQLPDAPMTNVYVDPTPLQKRLYKQIQEEQDDLSERLKKLKKVKNKGSEIQETIDTLEGALQGKNALAIGASDGPELFNMSHSEAVRNNYEITDTKSPKLIELKRIVKEFIEMDYKVIIFSQFARMVKIIERELSEMTRCATLFGAKSSKQRDEAVTQFENDPFCGVIVMSDAGAEGLNLQFSKALINYDLTWNPSTIDQRVGRIQRLGSKYDTVNVFNIICKNMIDERMMETIENKRTLSESIIENTGEQNRVLDELTKKAANM